jgi:hypothetical protein
MRVWKIFLIQELINKYHYKTYLEIGVFQGEVFFNIKCKNKIAVDPTFLFSKRHILKRRILNLHNFNAKYFEKTSDEFFAADADSLNSIDICLIDGMHEFRYSLNDFNNVFNKLSDNGVIIIHDCNPQSELTAGSYEESLNAMNVNGEWHGDVWKTIVYLRSLRKDLNVFVADCDHGLGIITKRKPSDNMLNFESFESIDKLTYMDLEITGVIF